MPPREAEAIDRGRIGDAIPPPVHALLGVLWGHGHAAYVVGGSLRDLLVGRPAYDWDVATSALPGAVRGMFPGSHYENRFGTVLVPAERGTPVEVTTFRSDHTYADHRRPVSVTFTDSLELDLRRRDFTVNALAWGREGAADAAPPRLVDHVAGLADLDARLIRAVGDPVERFDEDALRLVRAARLAGLLDFEIEPATLDAVRRTASSVRHVAPERIGQELRKLVAGEQPSRGLRILGETGLLQLVLPELAAQRGVAQAKAPGADCWEHTLAAVDAAADLVRARGPARAAFEAELLVVATLFHDAGKPQALEAGRFPDHQEIGAEIAERVLRRLAFPRAEIDRVARLVREHMFAYRPEWSDAAVRRFVQRVGADLWEDLLALREADAIASGGRAGDPGLAELRARIEAELERGFPLGIGDLAIDGTDLRRELDLPEGPVIGRLLARLLESCTADPSRNTRAQALVDARGWLPELLGTDGHAAG